MQCYLLFSPWKTILPGDFGLGAEPRAALGGRRWLWKAMPGGSLGLVSSGTGCARDFP